MSIDFSLVWFLKLRGKLKHAKDFSALFQSPAQQNSVLTRREVVLWIPPVAWKSPISPHLVSPSDAGLAPYIAPFFPNHFVKIKSCILNSDSSSIPLLVTYHSPWFLPYWNHPRQEWLSFCFCLSPLLASWLKKLLKLKEKAGDEM